MIKRIYLINKIIISLLTKYVANECFLNELYSNFPAIKRDESSSFIGYFHLYASYFSTQCFIN